MEFEKLQPGRDAKLEREHEGMEKFHKVDVTPNQKADSKPQQKLQCPAKLLPMRVVGIVVFNY